MSCFATLKDALGVTIPGIRVAAFFYNGSRTGFAKYHYILQLYSDGRWLRALAVDVEPEWKISHRCSCTGAVHKGPHGHMGGDGTPWSEWWPIDRPYPPTPADNRRDFYEHFKLKASLVEDSTLCLEPYGVHNGVIIDLFSDDLP
ncbi:MAG TPA: hypothetical protein DCZ12_12100 [Gammaproteobacteria bacterium]|nr:hypothetical protein [Gammaproteobacteria bacterium]